MIERKWKTLAGQPVDLRDALLEEISLCPNLELHIGSDSQQMGQATEYVTVAVCIRPAKGGRVFFCRERVPRVRTLHERLYNEVWRSTELAMELTSTPDIGEHDALAGRHVDIHIDINVDERYASAQFLQELAGMCTGQGFNVLHKPDSWAASHAADHAVKHKDERRKPHAANDGRRGRRAS